MLHKYVKMLSQNNQYYTLDEYLEIYEEYADEYRRKCKSRKQELINREIIKE